MIKSVYITPSLESLFHNPQNKESYGLLFGVVYCFILEIISHPVID